MHTKYAAGWLSGFLLLVAPALGDVDVRVATFNIEFFDADDATQLNAAADILMRLGPDVVCVQEIDTPSDLNALGNAAGYPYRVLAHDFDAIDSNLHAGVLSKHPFILTQTASAPSLSGDVNAQDLTRNIIVAEVDIPGAAQNLVIMGTHWKSGTDDTDEFRRAIESIRIMQTGLPYDSAVIPYFMVGDMNADIFDGAESPSQFNSVPSGMPVSFNLGSDIAFPVENDAFAPLEDGVGAQNMTVVNARQKDLSDATRRASGRRLDYIWHSDAMTVIGSEVYDSQDEGLAGGLPKYGSPLPFGTSDAASDHLLVFVDVSIEDDQSGACCTDCGCLDALSEAECLALGGAFRGSGVACGEEVPPCPPPADNFRINEVLVIDGDPVEQQFIELVGNPGQPLCGLSILAIEGETLSKGKVDLVVPLDDCNGQICTLDSNGLFVVGQPDAMPDLELGFGIFEVGGQTILLVRDNTVAEGDDIDPPAFGGDGVADFAPGQILDAIGLVDDDYPGSDAVYYAAPVLGPDGATIPAGAFRCPSGFDSGAASDWVLLSDDASGTPGCIAPTPKAANPSPCGGDGDVDGDVDLVDFAAFQRCFGQSSAACAAYELDGDCTITLADLTLFTDRLVAPAP